MNQVINTSAFLDEANYSETRLPTEKAVSIDPRAYYDQEFYNLEKKQVFKRNWVVAGPVDRVINSGDILVTEVAGQSIIVTMDEDKELRAFYNVCRHRGARLCSSSGTTSKYIKCPYHSWGYNLKGECVGTPMFTKGASRREIEMHDMSQLIGFDKKDFSLFPVRVAQWGMLIFVCLDDTTPPLDEYVGDLTSRLANHKLNEMKVLKEQTYEINCNWKLLMENAIEYYHLPTVHPRLAKTSKIADHHRWQGTGMYCGICTSPVSTTDDSGWLSMKNLSSLTEIEKNSGYFFTLFPNIVIFIMPSHSFIIHAQPVGPTKTVETAWLMGHPDCVDEMSGSAIDEVMEFWDQVNTEDVEICEQVQQGVMTDVYPGGRMCYQFEEPVHRFQNMVIDSMVSRRHIPKGDE